MLKPAVLAHALVQHILTGMPERSMSQIVSKTNRLGERFVQSQRTRDRPTDLRHFHRMCDSSAIKIALVIDEDLRLVDQASKGIRMDDAITIALELTTQVRRRLAELPTATAFVMRRVGRQHHAKCASNVAVSADGG